MKTIFVSSTFKDMHRERNLLHTHIMPFVNSKLKETEEYARFLDFRWGIDTMDVDENIATKKVVSTCFDGIKNSMYIIVIIGNNYGTSVPHEIINYIQEKYKITPTDNEKSITELEIDYATNNRCFEHQNIVFYFKKEPCTKNDSRVLKLKEKIKKLYPNQIRYYDIEDANSFIKPLTDDILSWFKIKDEKTAFFTNKTENITKMCVEKFSCRENLLIKTVNSVFDYHLTVIYGKSGCGKTVFMGKLKSELSKICHTDIIYIKRSFYNVSSMLEKLQNFLLITITKYYPQIKLTPDEFENDNTEENIYKIFRLIDNIPEFKNIVFLMDGIDKLSSSKITQLFDLLKKHSQKCHFVISLDNPNKYIWATKSHNVFLHNLSDSDKKALIQKELSLNYKEISQEAIDLLIKKQDSVSPLYLTLAVKRLIRMQADDYIQIHASDPNIAMSIQKHIIKIIDNFPNNIDKMIVEFIEFSENIINKNQAVNIAAFLSILENGFTAEELFFLIERYFDTNSDRLGFPTRFLYARNCYKINKVNYSEIDFFVFLRYLENLIEINQYTGKIRFENTIIRDAVFEIYNCQNDLFAISNELNLEEKDRALSNIDLLRILILSPKCGDWHLSENGSILYYEYYCPLFHLINDWIKKDDKDTLELFATIFFDLLSQEGVAIIKKYLTVIEYYKKHGYLVEETLNSVRFLVKYLMPKLADSALNPIEYVPFLENCLFILKSYMNYSLIDNRLYLIMTELNIAIMCYNSNNLETALIIAKKCKAKLNSVPKQIRNPLYYDAVESYNDTVKNWGIV